MVGRLDSKHFPHLALPNQMFGLTQSLAETSRKTHSKRNLMSLADCQHLSSIGCFGGDGFFAQYRDPSASTIFDHAFMPGISRTDDRPICRLLTQHFLIVRVDWHRF